ncbi:MAG: ISAs1 family transposase [Candidatus Brocadia sp.]|nr:ISAs1 family transposase [Candidatus Brocadia sp.]
MNHEETRKSTANREQLHDIKVRPINRDERHQWDELIRRHHYLGLHSLIGESIRYLAFYQHQWLALIGWSASALKCKVRDQWIGWPSILQYQRLSFIANNSRFLILPHVRIPNLASYVLAQNLKRLSRDWQTIYNHPIYLAETFVDPQYFKGTCYKAQGWEFLGYTRGFAKCANRYYPHNQPKMVFVRLTLPDGRRKLSEPYCETQNTRKETKPMRLSLKDAESLKERLSQIPDPRMPRGKRHRKLSVMTISLCALLCSATSFAAIAAWAQSCSQNMLKRLGCRFNPKTRSYEPPSEPTIRRFLQDVDAEAVDAALYGWLQSLCQEDTTLAIDGKTLRGARQENGRKIHLLSAFLQQKGVVIAQCPVESKTNEIPVLQTLLDPLDIKDHVVTCDALHTQKDTARYLVKEKKADYLFTVKDNQLTLKQDIEDLGLVSFPPSAQNHRQASRSS